MAGIKEAKRCKVLYDMWVDIVWTINGVDHPSFFFMGALIVNSWRHRVPKKTWNEN